ncbi:2-C-methyl-D-erythritol 2,4-cyclodiphosphate synthase [secondary endosymbiont of Heteropsylla cubana]|uniref:2-C-methyl-D-erythritol 2,4-cyclodiphosphate synthase n=1 Tax=secondary endosymbiont of Heteropsylla cubana TaxID=134287 RepID=J3TGP7_9ENTR|nr:2-C-methyl-D-erythritol 2,4-cyclodiphosphate synthase [secondary endosymbiont of Heteropsylla cubana]AFP85662.1 2-C-methyl-D-erythritol 2,4-cyclodiphosphate synthase [secondary endosymbiont of Heteropsylla cubana]
MRIGHGFDVHKFGGDNPLIICGVHISESHGLLAHSDGDIALHATIDALLGAAALGDIGTHFSDNNPAFKGSNSRMLLRKIWKKISDKDYHLGNLDITLIAQFPKITPYIHQMRLNVSQDLNCHITNINIKATTTEQLGFIGRGEGIACEAVTLLLKAYNNKIVDKLI